MTYFNSISHNTEGDDLEAHTVLSVRILVNLSRKTLINGECCVQLFKNACLC